MSEHFIMIHIKLEIEINDKVMSKSVQQLWLQNLYFISRNIKIIYKLEEKTNKTIEILIMCLVCPTQVQEQNKRR